jgi:hypothetical protein
MSKIKPLSLGIFSPLFTCVIVVLCVYLIGCIDEETSIQKSNEITTKTAKGRITVHLESVMKYKLSETTITVIVASNGNTWRKSCLETCIFENLPYGTYTVRVRDQNFKGNSETVKLSDIEYYKDVKLTVYKLGSLMVTVVNERYKPVSGVTVSLYRALPSDSTTIEYKFLISCNQDAACQFSNLKEGFYKIVVSKDGYELKTKKLPVMFRYHGDIVPVQIKISPIYIA